MIPENFVLIGVLVEIVAGASYIIGTIKGKVQPNKVSWLLWAIAPLIAFTAEIKQGVGIVSLTTFIVGFVPLIVFLASFVNKKAEWKIGRFDIICGLLSILGIVFWYLTQVGNVAILFSIFADALAALPTIVKSYKNPDSESSIVYISGIINAGIALLVIKNWNFENFGFPLYLLIVCIILSTLIVTRIGKRKAV